MTAYVATIANVSTHAFVCVSTAVTAVIAIVIGGVVISPSLLKREGLGSVMHLFLVTTLQPLQWCITQQAR